MYVAGHSAREDEEALLPQQLPPGGTSVRTTEWSSQWKNSLHSLSFRAVFWQGLAFMRPSFLRKRAPPPSSSSSDSPEKANAPLRKPHATEYLDGVRGVASLIVFILHWTHIPYPSVNTGWGYKDNTSFWLLPFIRIIYSGAAMVSIFFVVSGFVLSHRFIQRMQRQEYTELFSGLTSLTFRRAIRLFLPAFASSSMAFICASLRIVNVPRKVEGKPFHHSLGAYVDYLDRESNPWDWAADFSGFYNPQLWSIAVEFRGSMVVFLLIMGLAKTRTAVRIAVETLLMAHSFGHWRWDIGLFIAGMLLAELEVILQKPKSPSKRRIVNALLMLSIVLGLFLCGYPRDHNTQTPGYMWSKYVWPFTAYRRRFWLAVGAILVVGPMVFMPSIQSIFLTRPARYLGRISFALYLVHGLGNRTIGKWLLNGCWDHIGKEGYWPYTISYIVSTALYFPIVIWASDMFWRGIDVPSTNFARWFEKKCAASSSITSGGAR
ncbi:acyltransferase family-domain-containing protein [Hypoxylon fragiforme]|uniref:acyltransferase family-domain-containing protein n=1 Tax=Hypoxylon fragiforme TaxID=63214 RepID=UPI0020C69700|nr:acyltransferase family-domain-containing protein [Hypoxylon fragiforme]KAI2613193.1 acyltransferase family-domain-containing protein [Hypoxylon fragiforme]